MPYPALHILRPRAQLDHLNMHVDACINASHMQVRGRKRLLLWEPGALGMLKMYPALHILRRRARLCPTRAGDLAAHPSFAAARVVEVLLWLHDRAHASQDVDPVASCRRWLQRQSLCMPGSFIVICLFCPAIKNFSKVCFGVLQ